MCANHKHSFSIPHSTHMNNMICVSLLVVVVHKWNGLELSKPHGVWKNQTGKTVNARCTMSVSFIRWHSKSIVQRWKSFAVFALQHKPRQPDFSFNLDFYVSLPNETRRDTEQQLATTSRKRQQMWKSHKYGTACTIANALKMSRFFLFWIFSVFLCLQPTGACTCLWKKMSFSINPLFHVNSFRLLSDAAM